MLFTVTEGHHRLLKRSFIVRGGQSLLQDCASLCREAAAVPELFSLEVLLTMLSDSDTAGAPGVTTGLVRGRTILTNYTEVYTL